MPAPEGRLRTPRVLVVEDERRLRALLIEMIPELGFAACGVASGEEALTMMQTDPRDIVLLDLQLPGIDGMQLFEHIRHRWPATEVVVLTAFGDLQTAQRAIHLDAVEFLCKPFHLRDIELAFDRARKRSLRYDSSNTAHAPPVHCEQGSTLAQAEYRQILASLQRHAGNRTAAAQELGISRRTIHYRLAEYRDRGWVVE